MLDGTHSRRSLLRAGAGSVLGAVGLAGCLGGSPGSLAPQVPRKTLEDGGWQGPRRVDRRETQQVSMAGVEKTVHAHLKAVAYTHPHSLPDAASTSGLDAQSLSLPGKVFGAGKIETKPDLASLLSLSGNGLDAFYTRLVDQAKPRLEDAGFRDIRRVADTTLAVTNGHTARYHRYEATYPYEQRTFTRDGTTVTLHAGDFPVELQSAVWVAKDLLVGAVGLHPASAGQVTVSANGETQTVALGFTPNADRQQLTSLMSKVS